MRTTLPAAAIVVVLVIAVQVFIDQWRTDSANEARARGWRETNAAIIATLAAAAAPTSQPTTQPARDVTAEEVLKAK